MQINLSLFKNLVDFLIPLKCIKCDVILNTHDGLCPSCWPLIPFITKPFCACCGLPFEFDIDEEALCGACSYKRPFYITLRSVFSYTNESKDLILKFKHGDVLSAAPLYAKWMTRVFEAPENSLCLPVPLHWTRLFGRTYNQAALLARELSKLKGWTYLPSVLKRVRRTPSQGHLSKEGRVKNVEQAFGVSESKRHLIEDQNIILVDDVFTTGATLNACAKALLKTGAKNVHGITLGRVIKSHRLT